MAQTTISAEIAPGLKRTIILSLLMVSFVRLMNFAYFNYMEYSNKSEQQHVIGRDFYIFYLVAKATEQGMPQLPYNEQEFYKMQMEFTGTNKVSEYGYPPTYTAFIEFLALFSYKNAFLIWVILQIILFIIAGYKYIYHHIYNSMLYLGMPVVVLSLNWGQNGVLIAAFYFLAFKFIVKKPWLAGLFLALASIKPHLGCLIFVYLLVAKHYSVIISSGIYFCLFILYTITRYGYDIWLKYFYYMLGSSNKYIEKYNQLTLSHSIQVVGIDGNAAPFILYIIIAGCAIYCFRLGRLYRTPSPPTMAMVSIATSIILPYFNGYDYVLCHTILLAALINVSASSNFSIARTFALLFAYTLDIINKTNVAAFLMLATLIIMHCLFYGKPSNFLKLNASNK